MGRSPAHFRYVQDHGIEETAAMRIGSRAHSLLLEGGRRFAVYPKIRRGKEWDAFAASLDGDVTVLNEREESLAFSAALAVKADPDARDLLTGAVEKQIRWEINGRACFGTPDALTLTKGDLSDLKVTADASPEKFPWHAGRQGWLAQLVWYKDGLVSIGREVNGLHLVAVEAKPPHVVTCYRLTTAAEDLGRRTYRALFERLQVCEAANHWPGYAQTIIPLDSPEEITLSMDGEEFAA